MNAWIKRIGMIALVAVMAFGVVGTAAAQGPGPERQGPGGPEGPRFADRGRVLEALLGALQEATGLTWDDVAEDVQAGKTIGELLVENGLDPDEVSAQVIADLNAEIDAALAEGTIREAVAERLKGNLDDALDRVLNTPLPRDFLPAAERFKARVSGMADQTLIGTIAELAGMEPRDVLATWREGGTLAEVVEANGLTVEQVIAEATANITERVNEAVAAGTISEEMGAEVLAELNAHLTERMAMTAPIPQQVRERIGRDFDAALIAIMAEMAGMEPGEMLREALTPPTGAEIAISLGLDPDAIIDEAVARITVQVEEAVAEGNLTEEQAAQLLDGLRERLEDRMTSPVRLPRERGRGPANMGPGQGGHGPMGPGQGPNAPSAQPADPNAPASTDHAGGA